MADTDFINATTEEDPSTLSTAHPGEFQNQLQTLVYIMSVVLTVSMLTNTFTILVLRKAVFNEVESILYCNRLLAFEDMLTCSGPDLGEGRVGSCPGAPTKRGPHIFRSRKKKYIVQ